MQAVAGTFLYPLHGDQCSTLNRSGTSVGPPFGPCASQVTVPHQTTRPTVPTSRVPTASRLPIHPFCTGNGDPVPADGKVVTSTSISWNHSTRVEADSHGFSAMDGSQVRTLDLDLGDCSNGGCTQLPLPFSESLRTEAAASLYSTCAHLHDLLQPCGVMPRLPPSSPGRALPALPTGETGTLSFGIIYSPVEEEF